MRDGRLTLSKALVMLYALAVLIIAASSLVSPVYKAYGDDPDQNSRDHARDKDCISGTHKGEDADYEGSTYLEHEIPCNVEVGAEVVDNVATLSVDVGPFAKDPNYDGSADISGKVVLFPPSGAPGATTQDWDNAPMTTSVMGGHQVTVHTGANVGAFVQVSAHSSRTHGITTGSYEGLMVCIAFCQKNSSIQDPSTIIKQTDKACATNDATNTDPSNYDNGDNPQPCVLSPNTWGFKVGHDSQCNSPNSAKYNTAECFGKRDIDYKPTPHENETPYTVISKSQMTGSQNLNASSNVIYAVATNKDLRPGIYGVTTVYTLTTEVP